MSWDVVSLLLSLTLGAFGPWPDVSMADLAPRAAFRPAERAVDNWRFEAARRLDVDPPAALGFLAGSEPRNLPRCVKLNNYWCVKGAGWNGMVAADAEGHVAFASALEGATVAALLLRRYYLEFERRTANDILSRWAPPQCGGPAPRVARGGASARNRPDGLALHGVGATLRARFLAARRGGRRVALRRSVVPDHVSALMRAPAISVGAGEPKIAPPAARLAALSLAPLSGGGAALPSVSACALDGQRLKNYAAKAIDGVAASPGEDLRLFEPDGTPRPALARLMENMSGVEIGPLKARASLVQAGIDAATAAMRAARRQAGAPAPAAAAPRP